MTNSILVLTVVFATVVSQSTTDEYDDISASELQHQMVKLEDKMNLILDLFRDQGKQLSRMEEVQTNSARCRSDGKIFTLELWRQFIRH